MIRPVLLTALLILCTLIVGCAGGQRLGNVQLHAEDTSSTLTEDLSEFGDFASLRIEQAADTIAARTRNPAMRQDALTWKTRLIDQFQTKLDTPNSSTALGEAWTLSARQSHYLSTGAGANLFAHEQPAAIAAAMDIQDRIESIACGHVSPQQYAALRRQVEDIAARTPMRGVFEDAAAPLTLTDAGRHTLEMLSAIPLAPIRTAKGIRGGVDTVTGLPAAADRFGKVVEGFPDELRWQAELFVANLQANDMLTSAMLDFHALASAAERIATNSDSVHTEIRATIDHALAGLKDQQEAFQQNIIEARALADKLDQLIARANTAASSWEQTADAVTRATREINTLVYPNGPPPPGAEDDGQPDFLDRVASASSSLAGTAGEIRTTLAEVRGLLKESKELEGASTSLQTQAATVLDGAEKRTSAAIDKLFHRALLLAAFALLILYEIIRRRIRRTEAA